MSTATQARDGAYLQALPTLAQTAEILDVSRAWVTRAVKEMGIVAIPWGNREKHLEVADVLRLGIRAKRHGLEAIAGELVDRTVQQHPEQADVIKTEIDEFFASLQAPAPAEPDEFVAFLRDALPTATADEAVKRYLDRLARLR